MGGNTHIIHRINLEIEVPEMRLANQVKEDTVRLFYNDILPKLEKYLDTLVPIDKHVQFNQLNLNLENLSSENFEKEFTQSLLQVFHEKTEKLVESSQVLKNQTNTEDEKVIKYTRKESTCESFLFFLETGRLPWWSVKSGELLNEQNLTEILKNDSEFQYRLISLIRENASALERLLNQYSLQFVFQCIFPVIFTSVKVQQGFDKEELPEKIIVLLQNFVDGKKSDKQIVSQTLLIFIKKIIRQIISNRVFFTEEQLRNIFDEFTTEATLQETNELLEFKIFFDEIRQEIKSLAKNNPSVTDFPETEKATTNIQKGISNKLKNVEIEEVGIFVDDAGLVLLHPFLSSFFADFELLAEGKFKDAESQTIAVHLLHYLATKQEFAAEYELFMEKFLCGWDVDLPIAREVTLSAEMKAESETLLKAAIKHWSALKNTSPDGLREGFLQREGKLILNDFQDRLIIESKAQDVLLSYLPWGYSIFKLAWMKNALYVDWI